MRTDGILPGERGRQTNQARRARLPGGLTVASLSGDRTRRPSGVCCAQHFISVTASRSSARLQHCLNAQAPRRLAYKQKWPPQRNGHSCVGKLLDQLALKKPARHTERTEGRTEQHCRDATVRNPDTGRAKKRPFSEAAQVKDSRNRYDPMQVANVPDLGT